MTELQLRQILPASTAANRRRFLDQLNESMPRYGIDTPRRIAAFIAQTGHESGSLRYVLEIASGRAYDGRKDLGNTQPGDGMRFKGRGLIQITGRANYKTASVALGADFVADPALLEEPRWAAESACWWWASHGLNVLADKGDFVRITRVINGGTNGLADRIAIWERAKKVFGVA